MSHVNQLNDRGQEGGRDGRVGTVLGKFPHEDRKVEPEPRTIAIDPSSPSLTKTRMWNPLDLPKVLGSSRRTIKVVFVYGTSPGTDVFVLLSVHDHLDDGFKGVGLVKPHIESDLANYGRRGV